MPTPKRPLAERLQRFQATWFTNPGAQLDFYRLVRETLDAEGREAQKVVELVDAEVESLRRIGVR